MFDFFFSMLGAVFGEVVKTVAAIASVVTSTFTTKQISISDTRILRDAGFDRLHEVNEELESLRKQQYKNTQEIRRLENLVEMRDELKHTVAKQREILAADAFVQNQNAVSEITINADNLHILQWNAFADVISKNCPSCKRKMKVQWANNSNRQDFFWGCVGYYGGHCTYKQPLSKNDLQLLTDTSSEELQISTKEFDSIVMHPNMQTHIIHQVNDLSSDLRKQNKGVDIVCCPTHGQPMFLAEKKANVAGLLDRYHLKCPHYILGCSYMEKLKSGAQLAALLKHETGRGIL